MTTHTRTGNCWHESVAYDDRDDLDDVCHEHDESRGNCEECSPCKA